MHSNSPLGSASWPGYLETEASTTRYDRLPARDRNVTKPSRARNLAAIRRRYSGHDREDDVDLIADLLADVMLGTRESDPASVDEVGEVLAARCACL